MPLGYGGGPVPQGAFSPDENGLDKFGGLGSLYYFVLLSEQGSATVNTLRRRIGNRLKSCRRRFVREVRGALSFEWVLLITLLIIGIVGGLSGLRDALIDELGDLSGAAVAIDQSYTVIACQCPNPPSNPCFQVRANSFGFQDAVPECNGQPTPQRQRGTNPVNQTKQPACPGGGFNP